MIYFDSDYFTYQNNKLFCEKISVEEICRRVETPVYIYSKNFFIDRYKEFSEAFKEVPHTIFFALKSNFNLNVIKTFADLGSGVDVNSEGELYRALKAGVDPKKMILTGVGKTVNEIKLGLEKKLLMIKAESEEEIELINEIAEKMGKVAEAAIRVNPDVDVKSHPYISTGLSENKFGINAEDALRIYKNEKKYKSLKFTGIDMHIGSQITSVEPIAEAIDKLSQLYFEAKSAGVDIQHFDIGGGIGVKYNNEKTFSYKELADKILPKLKKLECDIFFEPGRILTANGGILATEVLYTKKNNDKNFIIVDAAMNDLLRPSIYGAYHHIQSIEVHQKRNEINADIVGP
ncbi:MAG: diaminopimelate decarboxylase, partial [Ignavibacteriaceae bacterium]